MSSVIELESSLIQTFFQTAGVLARSLIELESKFNYRALQMNKWLSNCTHIESSLIGLQNSAIQLERSLISPPPVKPEGTIGLHSVRHSVCHSVCLSVTLSFPDFSWLCFQVFEWNLVASFNMKSYRSSSTFITVDPLFLELCPLFKIRFPDFSWRCFQVFEWNLVASFNMKSYISSSTFVMVDLLFHELLSFFKIKNVQRNNGCRFEFVWDGGGPVLL